MKKNRLRIFTLVLAFVVLCCSFPASASAEIKVDFVPDLRGGRIYGIPLNTTEEPVRAIYYDKEVTIYDKSANVLEAGNTKIIGTGFTVKLGDLIYTAVVMGDVTGDGMLSIADCIMVKRNFLGTANLSSIQKEAGGATLGGELRAIHYVRMKRAILGTYNMNRAYDCEPYSPETEKGEPGWTQGWI